MTPSLPSEMDPTVIDTPILNGAGCQAAAILMAADLQVESRLREPVQSVQN